MGILEEKEHRASEIIKEALSDQGWLFALHIGDKPGMVLLHMLRTIGGGNITVPVINFQFLPMPGETLRFVDKLRRMWSLDFEVARFPEKPDCEQYTEVEVLAGIDSVLFKLGTRRVLSSSTVFFEGDVCYKEMPGWFEFRPLCGFSDEDISIYAERHRLPACSIDLRISAAKPAGAAGRGEYPDNKELADRLKKLGYL